MIYSIVCFWSKLYPVSFTVLCTHCTIYTVCTACFSWWTWSPPPPDPPSYPTPFHLLTDNKSVKSPAPLVCRWLWSGNMTYLEVASKVVAWWIVAFCAVKCDILKILCNPRHCFKQKANSMLSARFSKALSAPRLIRQGARNLPCFLFCLADCECV